MSTPTGHPVEWVGGIVDTLIPAGSSNRVGPTLRVGTAGPAAVILAPASYTGINIIGIDELIDQLLEARRRLTDEIHDH